MHCNIDRSRNPQHAVRLALVLLLAVLATPAVRAADIPLDHRGLPLWEIAQPADFPVRIELAGDAELAALLDAVPLAGFSREQIARDGKGGAVVFTPRVTADEAAALEAAGWRPKRLPDPDLAGRREAEAWWAAQAELGFPARAADKALYYPTHAQIGADLATLAATYPTLARTFTMGYSVLGREQWGIVISDDVNGTEAEPEVRLSASIHGDEPVDMVMLWNFAHYLLQNYGQPGFENVTDLVDNTEIHIIPLYNPDGYVAGSRYNDNSIDLNRNFPEPAGTHPTTELENLNFMAHASANHFVISQNGHGGALVANYPWDYTYTRAPDDAALIRLSLEYSTYNLPMYNGSFPQGITNGADWYVVDGSLQDWSYHATGCIDVTMEVSSLKWPAASTLDGFWDDNRESLLHYVAAARCGINGVVTGSDTGLPLAATVTVTGNTKSVTTDPEHGDYYKLLDSGSYQLTFSAPGYLDQVVSNVSTTWGTPTVLDVVLDPVAHGDVSGVVTAAGGAPVDALIEAYTLPLEQLYTTITVLAADGGAYTASLPYGDYRLVATAVDHADDVQDVTIGAAPAAADFSLAPVVTEDLLASDFESGMDGWSGAWGLAGEGYASGASLTDSPGGSYASSINSIVAMSSGVDLTDVLTAELRFWAKWDIENSWDACFLEMSLDGGSSWSAMATAHTSGASGQGSQTPAGTPCYDDVQSSWVQETIDLAAWIGQTDVRFRFRLATDSSVVRDGFYCDDFRITVTRTQGWVAPVPEAAAALAVAAYPNPFNPATSVVFAVPRTGAVDVRIYDVQGRLVRTLEQGRLAAGQHRRVWDGCDESGLPAGSGVYLALVRTGGERAMTKLMLLK